MNSLVKGCLRKKPYREAEARQLVGLVHHQRPGDGRQHVYHCDACGWWHIGHRGRRARRR
jgi:hypothetical protein